MINDRTTTTRRSNFLGCFGCSGEKNMDNDDEVNSTSRSRRWLSEWSFSCKKSVNVDFTTVPRKSRSVNETPSKSDKIWDIQVVDGQQNISRKNWTDIVKRQNRSFRSRRKDIKPAATSATDAAGVESPVVSSPLKPLTYSKSIPAVKRQKPRKPAAAAGGGVDHKGVLDKTTSLGGEFDSIIAMSILLAILVIMVLWGKLCAIFCTCAWFFIAPRLVAGGERADVAEVERGAPELVNKLNLESVEYKKKVVLEGLLHRSHRNVVGRL